MAQIPSLEKTLSQIRKSIGLKRNSQEDSFSRLELSMAGSTKLFTGMLKDIFDALNMDEQASLDALDNLHEWGGFNKYLELRVWTGNASQQQVLWHILAYLYVPILARRLAFWSLSNPSADADMPGGRLWYLPYIDQKTEVLALPVKQVLNWLIDLSGGTSVNALMQDDTGQNKESVIRTLHNWLNGSLPKSAETIDEIFHDNLTLSFKGVFTVHAAWTLQETFDAAITFLHAKGLDQPAKVHAEIPLSFEELNKVFCGAAIDLEKEEFIRQVAARFAKPAMSVIRQRFKVARMMQDGYSRLLSFLCPDVAHDCTDPAKNKLLQLLGLFQTIYDLTHEAYELHPFSDDQQDAWFESKLAPWDKADLLMAITPSFKQSAYSVLAERLTRKFMQLTPDAPLVDLVPWSIESSNLIIERRMRLIKDQHDEDVRSNKLRDRVRVASPWRALLNEDSFWVLSQLACQEGLPSKTLSMILKRMRELSETDSQVVQVNLIELGTMLNVDLNCRDTNCRQRVQQLLDESEQSAGFDEWKAPLLRLRAKHHLFQNDFEGAIRDFKAAIDASSERGFGSLRGEIARDGFATELMVHGFIPENQEIYYRNLITFMEIPNGELPYEDAAVECEDFFWRTLYQPYADVERIGGFSSLQYKAIVNEATGLIANADWDSFIAWLSKNARKYRTTRVKDARRNSLLLAYLKIYNSQVEALSRLKKIPSNLQDDLLKIQQFIDNYRQAIVVLVNTWPEQTKICDWKRQTPLMLVAERGDASLAKLFLPLSDVNAQDYLGRTALHAAVGSNSKACLLTVLEAESLDVAKLTLEGNNALHIAVRLGLPEMVNAILDEFPGLANQQNQYLQTPLAMAEDIYKNFDSWKEWLQGHRSYVGTKADIEEIIEYF